MKDVPIRVSRVIKSELYHLVCESISIRSPLSLSHTPFLRSNSPESERNVFPTGREGQDKRQEEKEVKMNDTKE